LDGHGTWKALTQSHGGTKYADSQTKKAYDASKFNTFDGTKDLKNIGRNWSLYISRFMEQCQTLEEVEGVPMVDSRKCYYFVEGIATKDSRFQDYARRYDLDEQFRASVKICQRYWEKAILEAENAVALPGVSGPSVAKLRTVTITAKSRRRSLKKWDNFNPSPPLTLALLDEVWNKAEWAALTRETKDYIVKQHELRRRTAAAMSSSAGESQSSVSFADPVDDAATSLLNQIVARERRKYRTLIARGLGES
jgi:hypothetical protein